MAATSLPLEILVLIMDGWDTKSLLKIRLVSRSWYSAAMCAMADYVRGLFAEVSYNCTHIHSIRGFPYHPTFQPTYARTPEPFLYGFQVKPEESSRLVHERVYVSFDWDWSTPGHELSMVFNRAGSVPLPPQNSQVVPIVMEAWISVIKHHTNLRATFNQSHNSFDYELDDDVITARARRVDQHQIYCSSQRFRLPDPVVKALNLAPEMTIVYRRKNGDWFMERMEFKL